MATKEMKTALLGVGTAFLSAAVAMLSAVPVNYYAVIGLAVVGIAAFYLREVVKDEEPQRYKTIIK